MNGISLAELEQRHADCAAARAALHRDFEDKDLGYAYVLGELEQLIALVEARQTAETERTPVIES
jgi:hypothetical protein